MCTAVSSFLSSRCVSVANSNLRIFFSFSQVSCLLQHDSFLTIYILLYQHQFVFSTTWRIAFPTTISISQHIQFWIEQYLHDNVHFLFVQNCSVLEFYSDSPWKLNFEPVIQYSKYRSVGANSQTLVDFPIHTMDYLRDLIVGTYLIRLASSYIPDRVIELVTSNLWFVQTLMIQDLSVIQLSAFYSIRSRWWRRLNHQENGKNLILGAHTLCTCLNKKKYQIPR